jgi:NADH-quinone oxidoreductase subunit M
MIFFGGIKALLSTDYKVLLAYSSISQLGFIAFGIGSGTVYGLFGSVLHIIAHGLAKTGLFIGSGYLVKEYGTRCIYNFKNVWKKQSFISLTILVSFASLMGIPLLAGYNSKYLIKLGVKNSQLLKMMLHGASLLTVFYASRALWWTIFKDFPWKIKFYTKLGKKKHFFILLVSLLLLLLGVFPNLIMKLELNFHLLKGLRDNLIYILITVIILKKSNWFKVKEKETPSLDLLFTKVYKYSHSLSTKTLEYNSELFFENHLYKWIYNSSHFIHSVLYTDFQSQLLWIPLLLFGLLLWGSLLG